MSQIQTTSPSVHLTLAVTGSAGSGKSSVCRHIARRGGHLIDADQIAREVVMPGSAGLKKVVEHFGPSIVTRAGALDRSALRRRILSDAPARKALEAILHPEILSAMDTRINMACREGREIIVVEVPLLFELGMASHFDKVVLVKAHRHIKVQRLMDRDCVSKADAEGLLNLQMPDAEKEKLSDIVIENNGSPADLIKYVDRLLEMIYLIINGRRQNDLTGL